MSHEEHLTILKGKLVDDLRHTAEWRESKAEEYPEDDRNEAAVQSLNALAEKLEALDHLNDLLFLDYAGFWSLEKYENSGVNLAEIQSETLRGVGFHHDFENTEEFLGHLIREFRSELED